MDVRVSHNNYDDLIQALNFNSSLYSAEAVLKSALAIEKSRGSHQRKDFLKIKNENIKNYKSNL